MIFVRPPKTGSVVRATKNGAEYIKIDLKNAGDEPFDFDIGEGNRARIDGGGVSMISADCPDKLCMKRGRISGGDLPIVCLPNRVVISIED